MHKCIEMFVNVKEFFFVVFKSYINKDIEVYFVGI